MVVKYERYLMLLEYNQSLINKLIIKFKAENNTLTDEIIIDYINRFDKYKNNLESHQRDISKYSFSELEYLIDSRFPKKIDKNTISKNFDDEAIYNENNLLIFEGDTKDKCIKYGSGESWCISRNDTSNMFNTYRYKYDEINFYFIFDKDRDDNFSKVVLLVDKDGNYYLANKSNSGDFAGNKNYTWNKIVKLLPKLNNLKYIFKPKPLTVKEREEYELLKDKITDDDLLSVLKTYDLVEKYISFGHTLSTNQFISLDKKLKNKYINLGHVLDFEKYNSLDENLKNRYVEVGQYIEPRILDTLNTVQFQKYIDKTLNERVIYTEDIHLYFNNMPENIIFPKYVKKSLVFFNLKLLPSGTILPTKIDNDLIFKDVIDVADDVIFPEYVGRNVKTYKISKYNMILPKIIKGDLILNEYGGNVQFGENFKFPININDNIQFSCEYIPEHIIFPLKVKSLIIHSVKNLKNIKLPKIIEDTLFIGGLNYLDDATILPKSVKRIVLPKKCIVTNKKILDGLYNVDYL